MRYIHIIQITVISVLSFSFIAKAETVMPSHVYQTTEELRLKLDALGLIDTSLYETTPDDTALRHPRHVMQKVRECHTIFSKILNKNNINPKPIPHMFSTGEVKPKDVQRGINNLLSEIDKLSDKDIPVSVDFVPGKLPGDVYNNLERICRATRMEILPSDVYQIATAVKNNVVKLSKSRGYEFDIDISIDETKKPADVYQKTYEFLTDLRLLAFNPDYAIPGGVIFSETRKKGSNIIPKDVMSLMNDALAETEAIKYTLHIKDETIIPVHDASKNPPDVFAQISHAHEIIKRLLVLEANDNAVIHMKVSDHEH